MNRHLLYVTAATLMLGCSSAIAGDFIVPHQPGDTVTIHVRPGRYAHPSDYWWQRDPSSQGKWDYFTPVDHLQQPVRLEAEETLEPWYRFIRLVPMNPIPGETKPKTASIPVTNLPLH
ncbi:MAG: hypothetical protein H7834_12565 [Magnetococcus sp. YQC-9]